MQTPMSLPVVQRLVLVGGGHAHVQVLRAMAMRPIPQTEVILISRDTHTPYSGMLPGLIAGHYHFDDCHIDLAKLARRANARFIATSVQGIDPVAQVIFCDGRLPLHYDYLSINTGSTPNISVKGAADYALPVKPIDQFLQKLPMLLEAAEKAPMVVVGGGAAGVEVAMALRYRLSKLNKQTPIQLVARQGIMPKSSLAMREKLQKALSLRSIDVIEQSVIEVHPQHIVLDNGAEIDSAATIWATGAKAATWLKNTGISCDAEGFIAVNPDLSSCSHDNIFAAGDIASMITAPRPKAGVFAVRQGAILRQNLYRVLAGQKPRSAKLQQHFLTLIACGEQYAIGGKYAFAVAGRWVWRWKDYIDRQFMAKFTVEPMPILPDIHLDRVVAQPYQEPEKHPMRCSGCGGKVSGDVLRAALSLQSHVSYSSSEDSIELADAAQYPRENWQILQSIDVFTDAIFDDYRLGQLIAVHASNDILASGQHPEIALSIIGLPAASERIQSDRLGQIFAGMSEILSQWDCRIIGGHTLESEVVQVGLSITALKKSQNTHIWQKSGAKEGDRVLLTSPIGSGILLAGYQAYRSEGSWLNAWLSQVLASRLEIIATMQSLSGAGQIRAVTDVSGFGLLGHLSEVCQASQMGASLDASMIPWFAGAESLATQGVQSSLKASNQRYAPAIFQGLSSASQACLERLLYDPQTAGGFLVVADVQASEKLEQCGAYDIGEMTASKDLLVNAIN